MLGAALLSLSLIACSASNSAAVIPRNMPGVPAYMKPVYVADPKIGEDPLIIAARERAGRIQANRIIVRGGKEWSAVQKEFASK